MTFKFGGRSTSRAHVSRFAKSRQRDKKCLLLNADRGQKIQHDTISPTSLLPTPPHLPHPPSLPNPTIMSYPMHVFTNSHSQSGYRSDNQFAFVQGSASVFNGLAPAYATAPQQYPHFAPAYPTAPAPTPSSSSSIFGGLSSCSGGGSNSTASSAAWDYGVTAPHSPSPTGTRKPKKRSVRFGGEEVRYITPSPQSGNFDSGFAASGFAALGSVGETEAFNPRGSWHELTSETDRRACAPISASRLVQRRWRSAKASGRR